MAKRKTVPETKAASTAQTSVPEPEPSRSAFLATISLTLIGLVIQYIIAFITYPSLGTTLPSAWLGWTQPGGSVPSSLVFVAFPGAQVIIFLIGFFSPKDSEGRRVMDLGKAISLILLAVLFTALQISTMRFSK